MEVGQGQKSIELAERLASIVTLAHQTGAGTGVLFLSTYLPKLLFDTLSCHALYLYCSTDNSLHLAGNAEDHNSQELSEEYDQRNRLAQRCWQEQHPLEETLSHSHYYALWLHLAQQTVGVMLVCIRSTDLTNWQASWGNDPVRQLQIVADIVAFIVEQARQREADHKHLKELSRLNNTAQQMNNARLLEEVVEARNQAHKLLKQVLDDRRLKELILSTMPSGLITTDQHGYIQTFNHAAETILGYQAYDIINTPLQNLVHITIPPFWLHNEHPADISDTAESTHWHKQTIACSDRYNREVVLDVDIRPLYDEIKNQPGLLVMFSDVTLVHHLEDEKQRLDHLASLGEMAASVAHEVRNPLASIKMSMQLLRDEIMDGADEDQRAWMQESIVVVLQEVERLDAIVRDLLLFAKPHQLHRSSCEIAHIIEQVLRVIASQCRELHVEVKRTYDSLPPLCVDSAQMEQIFLNITINALQAMPEGGTMRVSCHLLSTEQAIFDTAGSSCPPTQKPSGSSGTAISAYAWLIDKHATQKEFRVQHWLEVLVSDTGTGIAPEQLQHIFQPFYTTKAHGIGLGLAITRRLVEDHGGYLRIESQPNYGTTVAVRIPFVTEANLYTLEQQSENIDQDNPTSTEEIKHI